MTQFDQRNLSMMMDFYEMTMANGYFADHDKDTKVAFDVFYRKNPDEGGFAIFAGLEQVIEYVENMRFSESDIEYFRAQHMFSEAFLDYLRDFRFTGDIYAMPEGTVMYPDEPILTVVGSLIDAQLVETAILAQINHQSLIATKSRRICKAAAGRAVSDFGARRELAVLTDGRELVDSAEDRLGLRRDEPLTDAEAIDARSLREQRRHGELVEAVRDDDLAILKPCRVEHLPHAFR